MNISIKFYCRGHGTFVEEDKLIASVSGVVEKVNKLISVRPIRARYKLANK